MAERDDGLKFLGRMFDPVHEVTTDFFLESKVSSDPRWSSKGRRLVARSSDGRPEFATEVPDEWSDDLLLGLIDLSGTTNGLAPEADNAAQQTSEGKYSPSIINESRPRLALVTRQTSRFRPRK